MNTIINNTTINVTAEEYTIEDLFELSKRAKERARAEMAECIPVGPNNAKTAKEILGDSYRHLASICSISGYDSKLSKALDANVRYTVLGDGTRIYKRVVTIQKTYVNTENPLDIMTINKKRTVYWR